MKFGGSSVADPDKIRHVARRLVDAKQRGLRVVGTVSAMGKTTDGLIDLAHQVSPDAERARVRHAPLDGRADRLRARRDGDPRPRAGGGLADGLAGRHPHRRGARQGEDPRDPRRPGPGRARSGQDRARRRVPGLLARHDGDHDPRPRRHRCDGRRARGSARRRLRDLLGRARRLHRRPAARAERAQAGDGLVRGDARDVGVGREGPDAALGRARPQSRRSYSCPLHVLGRGGHLGSGRRSDGAANRVGGDPQRERRGVHAVRHPRPSRRGGADLRRRRGRAGERRHDHPERRPRQRRDVVLRARRGRARHAGSAREHARTSSARSRSRRTTTSARCR